VLRILLAASYLSFSALSYSAIDQDFLYSHRLYGGGSLGYGSTTWYGLVPAQEKQNMAMSLSTPTLSQEGGLIWGGVVGYEFNPFFALEINYQQYPQASLVFDEESLFAFDHNDNTLLNTKTEVVFALAKIMVMVPNTPIRVYSGAGVGDVHRNDQLNNHWLFTPSFGAGVNYLPTPHIMAELAANYTAGYGESELNPVEDYIPFLYSVCVKLVYRY